MKLPSTIFGGFFLFIAFQYLYKGSPADLAPRDPFKIIAHRGVHPDFHRENLDNHTCTATRIYKPTHDYIENTIESIQAAFDFGATVVEIDVRPTKDKQIVVFHDSRLECRTNAKGNIWDYSLDDLRKLDIGFGYTYDDGKSYPFRGKGVGKMQTLSEILHRFPDKKFLIDNKSGNNLKVAELIADLLVSLPREQQRSLYLWTQDGAYERMRIIAPGTTRLLLPRQQQIEFFKSYILSFGLRNIGDEYRNEGLGIPIKYTKYLVGWPYRFLEKMSSAGVRFYIIINTKEELEQISDLPLDGIITDHIEIVGKNI